MITIVKCNIAIAWLRGHQILNSETWHLWKQGDIKRCNINVMSKRYLGAMLEWYETLGNGTEVAGRS